MKRGWNCRRSNKGEIVATFIIMYDVFETRMDGHDIFVTHMDGYDEEPADTTFIMAICRLNCHDAFAVRGCTLLRYMLDQKGQHRVAIKLKRITEPVLLELETHSTGPTMVLPHHMD